MFKSRSPKKEECIMPMRCITFDKKAQDNLPDDIKAKKKENEKENSKKDTL